MKIIQKKLYFNTSGLVIMFVDSSNPCNLEILLFIALVYIICRIKPIAMIITIIIKELYLSYDLMTVNG